MSDIVFTISDVVFSPSKHTFFLHAVRYKKERAHTYYIRKRKTEKHTREKKLGKFFALNLHGSHKKRNFAPLNGN